MFLERNVERKGRNSDVMSEREQSIRVGGMESLGFFFSNNSHLKLIYENRNNKYQ